MQSTIKSTLSLLISFGQAAKASVWVRGDADRSTTLDPQTNICCQRCLLSGFPPLCKGRSERGNVDRAMRWGDKVLADSLSAQIYCTQGEPDQSDQRRGGGWRYRLACEHSSMTSSTTELLDFMQTRPGEAKRKAVGGMLLNVTKYSSHFIIQDFYYILHDVIHLSNRIHALAPYCLKTLVFFFPTDDLTSCHLHGSR